MTRERLLVGRVARRREKPQGAAGIALERACQGIGAGRKGRQGHALGVAVEQQGQPPGGRRKCKGKRQSIDDDEPEPDRPELHGPASSW